MNTHYHVAKFKYLSPKQLSATSRGADLGRKMRGEDCKELRGFFRGQSAIDKLANQSQSKMHDRRKQALNKTFNRTKTDFEHNFIGRKYISQVRNEKSQLSLSTPPPPFRRSCSKQKHHPHNLTFSYPRRLESELRERECLTPTLPRNKRYVVRAKRGHTVLRTEQCHTSQITPWDIGGNGSWVQQF